MNPFSKSLLAIVVILFALLGSTNLVAAQAEMVNVTVNACVDSDCANMVDITTVEGAVVSTVDASGAVIESCTVTLTFSGMVDCALTAAPADGWYQVDIPAGYEGYTLRSANPEVLVSESHGTILVWHIAPAAVARPTESPTSPNQVPDGVVTSLPDTGTGAIAPSGNLVALAAGMVLAGIGATLWYRQHAA